MICGWSGAGGRWQVPGFGPAAASLSFWRKRKEAKKSACKQFLCHATRLRCTPHRTDSPAQRAQTGGRLFTQVPTSTFFSATVSAHLASGGGVWVKAKLIIHCGLFCGHDAPSPQPFALAGRAGVRGGPCRPTRTPLTWPPRCLPAAPAWQVETLSEPAEQASRYRRRKSQSAGVT